MRPGRFRLASLSLAARRRRRFVRVQQSVVATGGCILVVSTATIGERNQDIGARGSCVLSVDGIEADRADAIWVDAAGLVSCAFTHTFETSGAKSVSVQVANVVPLDYEQSVSRFRDYPNASTLIRSRGTPSSVRCDCIVSRKRGGGAVPFAACARLSHTLIAGPHAYTTDIGSRSKISRSMSTVTRPHRMSSCGEEIPDSRVMA